MGTKYCRYEMDIIIGLGKESGSGVPADNATRRIDALTMDEVMIGAAT